MTTYQADFIGLGIGEDKSYPWDEIGISAIFKCYLNFELRD